MKTLGIRQEVGIYNAEYVIRDYGDKIVVTVPYIRWAGNSGNLAYRKVRISDPRKMNMIRRLAAAGKTAIPDDKGWIEIQDIIN